MWRLLLALLLAAIATTCVPQINEPECETDEDCERKPGTVCVQPEGWCVRPEADAGAADAG